ncbi:1-aminocyclopropane-1-carboxylate oxidase homolog 4, partial [Linum perenne]
DLSGERSKVVEQVLDASHRFGFFQIVNHGIPIQVLDRCVRSVRGFHELPREKKEEPYGRQKKTGVSFLSNLLWTPNRDRRQIRGGGKLGNYHTIPPESSDSDQFRMES